MRWIQSTGVRTQRVSATEACWRCQCSAGALDRAIIVYRRPRPGPFSDKQIELLKTFADQAVIAIENVRLFNETRNALEAREVTEALEQQTATAEILRVISSSPTDVQPVFDAIVRSAVRLCEALFGSVFRFDGEMLHLVAHHNCPPRRSTWSQRMYPDASEPRTGGRRASWRASARSPILDIARATRVSRARTRSARRFSSSPRSSDTSRGSPSV